MLGRQIPKEHVTKAARAVVSTIWRTGASKSSARAPISVDQALKEVLADEQAAPTGDEAEYEYSVEEVFSQFKKGLDGVVRPADAETHLDLAIAYREMGLVYDAQAEAAIALQHGALLPRRRKAEAVSMLFDSRGLKVGLDEALHKLRLLLYPE